MVSGQRHREHYRDASVGCSVRCRNDPRRPEKERKSKRAELNAAILTHFRDQPLVGGALAFAQEQRLALALATETEDEFLGETADAARNAVSSQASTLVNQGAEIASDAYDKAVCVASDVHEVARDRVVERRLTSSNQIWQARARVLVKPSTGLEMQVVSLGRVFTLR